jgi:hypothetical protein
MIAALVIGTVLAVGALAFVLYPIFFGVPVVARPTTRAPEHSDRDEAVAALREIEFDRATGKLSDVDYADMKTRYTRQAIDAMRREGGSDSGGGVLPSDDEIEAAVRAFRGRGNDCPECGPRPEPDAIFCSNCGRYLRDRCAGCGAPVDAHDARFCVNCGNRLAA